MTFLEQPSRFLFFTGKGGVGKTAIACAAALRLADAGKHVLLVSTDPASNLDEMLGVTLSNRPTPIPGVVGLSAMDIDPEDAAADYRERVVAPYRAIWSEQQIAELREQLAGSCTVEIAAFDEFAGLLAGEDFGRRFDHVLFDTAPTGHTLRLLSLPRAWTGFLESTERGASCLGPHSGLTMRKDRFAAALAALSDAERTTVVLVTRPDRAALREAERTSGELEALGLGNQRLVVNAVFTSSDRTDPVALALEARGREALDDTPHRLRGLPATRVPLRAFDMVGVTALRALLDDRASAAIADREPTVAGSSLPTLAAIIDDLAAPGRGLVLVMGKGGVGKTTIAAAIATELATRGIAVHLSTTDPAAHVGRTVAGQVPNLTVSRIDPARETRLYVARQMDLRGRNLDEKGRALLAEDLRSPCYEEVAVFIAFSRLIAEARTGFVVLDTAPTGHTLLLLDSAYHRQIVGGYASRASGGIVTPLMRLGDPVFTRLLLVTLAETTPVSEATQLQADLRRAQIEPFSWVIDASLAAADSTAPILRRRIAADPPRRARARTAGGDRAVDGGRARRIGAAPSPRATRRAAPRRHARARALTGTSGRDGGASGHRGGGGHRPERAGLAFRRPDAISSCNDDATACTSIAWPAGAARWARGERVVTAGVSRAERPACSTTTGCEPADGSADLRPIEGPEADDELASLAKAVGHPARVQILRLLARRTACVCGDIVNELPLAQSTVSQHLKVLKEAGLVRGEVDGARVCYCLEPRALRRLKALVGGL